MPRHQSYVVFSTYKISKHKHLHSSPAVDGQTLHNQHTELEEEDKEEQEKVERAVPPATHSLLCYFQLTNRTGFIIL